MMVPMNMQMIAAPTVTDDPIHDQLSRETKKPYSPTGLSVGVDTFPPIWAVHPNAVPAAKAPPVAVG